MENESMAERGKVVMGDDELPLTASISPDGEIFYQMPRKSLICSEIGRRVPIVRHISAAAATLVLPVNEGQLASLPSTSSSSVKNLPKCCLMPSNGGKNPGGTSIEIKRQAGFSWPSGASF